MERRNVHTTLDEVLYKKIRKKAIDWEVHANDLIETSMKLLLKECHTKKDFEDLNEELMSKK